MKGSNQPQTPKQELDAFVGSGRLRDLAEKARLSTEATELLVDVVGGHCAPRRRRRS